MSELRWGIIGAGNIAHRFMQGMGAVIGARVTAVARRDAAKARAFADQYGIERSYGDAAALLADDGVDAVYVATPHPSHARWVIGAAEAGKAVLTEKPAGMSRWQVEAMVAACRAHGVFFMEGFKDRVHPLFLKLFETVESGAIGPVRLVDAAFGFGGQHDPASRVLNPELGGGGILDVGCYPVAFARRVAGIARGAVFADPIEVRGSGRLGSTGVDVTASAVLKFEGGVLAQVATSVEANLIWIRVFGESGWIEVPGMSWHPAFDGGSCAFLVHEGESTREVSVSVDKPMFAYQIEAANRAIAAGRLEAEAPAMSWADSLGQAATLDTWLKQAGVSYPSSTVEGFPEPLRGGKLKRSASATMTYEAIEGVSKPVSRLILGCDNQEDFGHAGVVFDAYFECGGNAFDTAWLYGGGLQERLLGQWLRSRGVRDDCVIVSKGGHTPACTPEGVRRQVRESLERLGVDRVELYILHRDNPDLPVGELVDVMDELVREGLVEATGASNWTIERFAAAQAYAAAEGRRAFSVLNNNLSLARMLSPVWPGCVSASDPVSLGYLRETKTAHLAWSSQARGYFARAGEKTDLGLRTTDAVFDSEENRERRARAVKLAERRGVSAVNIAAAYVLCQRFPSFALFGPRTLRELESSLPALWVELSERELEWLDLQAD
jgi:predicted dehydrogenase/aryl-alcohol dehydrogenase-like predicted oxidoreductase